MSEEEATSGKYWLSSIKPGIPLFAFCNMTTEGKYNITSIGKILFLCFHISIVVMTFLLLLLPLLLLLLLLFEYNRA